jgi:hypothetical protein
MIEEISSARAGTVLARPREMPDDQYNGIEIEVNVYERAGQWTGEYILTKRLEAYTLNEVNSHRNWRDAKGGTRAGIVRGATHHRSVCENDSSFDAAIGARQQSMTSAYASGPPQHHLRNFRLRA